MNLTFSKYQGSGNDFIVFDDRGHVFPFDDPLLIKKICNRKFGIGADGVLLLQSSDHADFRMRIFNYDGLEAAMCGNGIRCLVQFIRSLGYIAPTLTIETNRSVAKCSSVGPYVETYMEGEFPQPRKICLTCSWGSEILWVVDTGVPHVVLFKERIAEIDIVHQGQEIRFHPEFGVDGVNVNFVEFLGDKEMAIRTYERGVGETLACGTGAIAAALTAHFVFGHESPITITPLSQDNIIIEFNPVTKGYQNIQTTGAAAFVFCGHIEMSASPESKVLLENSL